MAPKTQQTLPLGDSGRKAEVWDDFRGLFPEHVHPTPLRVLQSGTSVLAIHHKKHGQQISRAQQHLFKSLVALGHHPDSPGSFEVLVVWGNPFTPRTLVLFDHMGEGAPRAMDHETYRAWLRDWFNDRRRR